MRGLLLWLCLIMMLCLPALAELDYSWQEGEAYFPEGEDWRYHYRYRYPVMAGDSFAAQAINEYFSLALKEQLELVLPMYANDPILAEEGQQQVEDDYQVTLNDGRLFSILLHHRQSLGDQQMLSLQSVVYAVEGEYVGESLTLRGVCGVGESSAQIAEAVIQDIWRQVAADKAAGGKGWLETLDQEAFLAGFFPQSQFYAAEGDRVVFYLQPGEFRQDMDVVTYPYSYEQLAELVSAM